MNHLVLGLDVSSSVIGIGLIDIEDLSLYGYGVIDLRKLKNDYDKFAKINVELQELKTNLMSADCMLDWVAVESPLLMFKKNASMARTISKLTQFNAVTRYLAYTLFEIEPDSIAASSARKRAIGLGRFPKGSNAKEEVLKHVKALYPEFVDYKTKTGKFDSSSYDAADGIVVARAIAMTYR
jgi:Holliday junction resolvasome RuvABC endonuclease subunit